MNRKQLGALAAVVVIVAGAIGYAVGSSGGGDSHTWEVEPGPSGIGAKVVRDGDRGEVRLEGLGPLPKGRVLEAWVERDGIVEAVPRPFGPEQGGRASTAIASMKGVTAVAVTREPRGGSNKPTTRPIVEVPIES